MLQGEEREVRWVEERERGEGRLGGTGAGRTSSRQRPTARALPAGRHSPPQARAGTTHTARSDTEGAARAASTDTAMPGTCSVEAGRARARLERMEGAQARRGERIGGMAAASREWEWHSERGRLSAGPTITPSPLLTPPPPPVFRFGRDGVECCSEVIPQPPMSQAASSPPPPYEDEAVDSAAPLLTYLATSLRQARARFGYLDALSAYRTNAAEAFAGDAAAGIVVAVMLVPQAMAYAQLSGMPPVTGFFAAILSLFVYPVFGSSGHQAVGPVALLALMTQAAVSEVAGDAGAGAGAAAVAAAAERYAHVAAKLAFMIGAAQMLMGVLRAGYVLNFLSHSVLAGFTTSSAVIIAASQLSKAFGFSTPQRQYLWQTLADSAAGLGAGRLHGLSVGLFVANMVLFYGLTEVRSRVMASAAVKSRPALKALLRVLSVALIVITLNILLVAGLRLDLKGVKVLGRIPSGMPPFNPAAVFDQALAADAFALLPSALLISLVSFVESASVAKSMQAKFGVTPGTLGADDSQELLGLGLANLATAVFSGFPVTGGFSRSTVNSEAGARTIMAGVFSGAILSVVVTFLTSWFYYLPDVSLAALIMFSALRLLEADTIRYLWTVDRGDALVWAITVAVTFGAGIELGLLVGAGVSVLRIVEKAAQPHTAVLGRMPDGATFRNVRRFPTLAVPVPGVVIVRLDGPLFFANVALFVDRVMRAAFPSPEDLAAAASAAAAAAAAAADAPEEGNAGAAEAAPAAACLPLQVVLLDFSTVASIDSAGVHALAETLPEALTKAAAAARIDTPRLVLVGARGPVRDRLRAGERAHANAHAHAHAPGCAGALWAAASSTLLRGHSGVLTAAEGRGASSSGAQSEAAVSLGGLYGGASASSGPPRAGRAASRPVVADLLARTNPATGELPAEALTLFWHVDLPQGVEAVEAMLRLHVHVHANAEGGSAT